MPCRIGRPCPGLAAVMSEHSIKFTQNVQFEADGPIYNAMFMHGLKFKDKDGRERLDSHILYYCPCCGVRFSSIIEDYAPPLIEDQKPAKSNLVIV
jgi:hypothetical protein